MTAVRSLCTHGHPSPDPSQQGPHLGPLKLLAGAPFRRGSGHPSVPWTISPVIPDLFLGLLAWSCTRFITSHWHDDHWIIDGQYSWHQVTCLMELWWTTARGNKHYIWKQWWSTHGNFKTSWMQHRKFQTLKAVPDTEERRSLSVCTLKREQNNGI